MLDQVCMRVRVMWMCSYLGGFAGGGDFLLVVSVDVSEDFWNEGGAKCNSIINNKLIIIVINTISLQIIIMNALKCRTLTTKMLL